MLQRMRGRARWLLIGICVAMIWTLGVALPAPLPAQTLPASKKYAGTTLNFAAQPDIFAGPIRRLLPRFEQESGIKVVMETIPYANLREKQLLDFTTKKAAYDVVTMDIVWMGEYTEAGWIEPLQKYIDRDAAVVQWKDLLPGAVKGLALWKGKVYGMPIGAYYYIMHYRADWFKNSGFKAPETLDDVRTMAGKFHNPANNIYGWSAGFKRGAPLVHDSVAYLAGAGGSVVKDFPRNLKPSMSSETALRVYKFYKGMLDYAPPGAISFDFAARREPFQQGKVALLGNWSSSSAAFEDPRLSIKEVTGNVGHSFMPRMRKGAKAVVPFGGWALVINVNTAKKDAAWEFVKWLTSPQIQKAYVADGGTAIRFSSVRDPEFQKKYKWYRLILEAEEKGLVLTEVRPRIPEWPQMEEIMGLHLSEAMAGMKPIEQALKEIDQKLEALLKKAGYPMK